MKRLTADAFRDSGMRGVNFIETRQGMRTMTDFDSVKALGADHVRIGVSIVRGADKLYTIAPFDLGVLDQSLTQLQKRGLYAVVMLSLPDDDRQYGMWNTPSDMLAYTTLCRTLAKRYVGRVVIAAFDILNEPVVDPTVWAAHAKRTIRAIREVDPLRVVIVEGAPNALPETMSLLLIDEVVYSIHSYGPQKFTHAGLDADWAKPPMAYGPDVPLALYESLRPAMEFQRQHDVPIYIGEFSAMRDKPGADNYISDSLALFRGQGWSYAYHAWRGWPGWDIERIDTKTSYFRGETEGLRILRAAMKRK